MPAAQQVMSRRDLHLPSELTVIALVAGTDAATLLRWKLEMTTPDGPIVDMYLRGRTLSKS